MNIKIDKSFEKDTERIKGKKVLQALTETISQIEKAATIQEIQHVKKMRGIRITIE